MPAIPDAPAFRHEAAFCKVTPPRASTGISARQAWLSASSARVAVAGASFLPNTGATTAKVTPFFAASTTSDEEWHETPTSGAELKFRDCQTLRTSWGETSSPEMHAVSRSGKGNVGAGVDEQRGPGAAGRPSACLTNRLHRI